MPTWFSKPSEPRRISTHFIQAIPVEVLRPTVPLWMVPPDRGLFSNARQRCRCDCQRALVCYASSSQRPWLSHVLG